MCWKYPDLEVVFTAINTNQIFQACFLKHPPDKNFQTFWLFNGKYISLMEQKFNFRTIIFSHTDQTPWGQTFLQSIVKDPDWNTVYLDNFMIVLVKRVVAAEKKLNVIRL